MYQKRQGQSTPSNRSLSGIDLSPAANDPRVDVQHTAAQLTAKGLRGYTTCMGMHPLAGQPAPASVLVDASKLIATYSSEKPDAMVREQRVAFDTSGHRRSAFKQRFNEWHIPDFTQAICEYRAGQGTTGPLTKALSLNK